MFESPQKSYATISLRTYNSYKAPKGYRIKVATHRIQVFDNSLIEKSRTLNKGDRICVYGHLTAFPMSTADKFWVYCIVARSISAFVNPVRCSDDFTATTTSDPTPLEPSAAQSM
ncbi:unnamed protein product [Dicrocoelium dendriticum]|nr:unnamed protein product [Dicrocoelium dendriticum]